ncbi:MAG TPA: PQQ-binding-like beta-propeller repeat protein [Candidatus Sulfotelmatobacter sp.]|nr:PQQ-binding-like beta-propeller repeat protein [Candidatus Sulfotelmatobacter sp.]
MRNNTDKTIMIFAVVTILLIAATIFLAVPVKAQEEHGGNALAPNWDYKAIPAGVTPKYTITSIPFMSLSPNPIGVGQTVLVNLWFTYTAAENRFLADFKVTITDPEGKQDSITLNSYVADSTAWFTYVPDKVGTWKLKFEFPGEYFPAGWYLNGMLVTNNSGTSYPDSTWYAPVSTAEQTLTVQNEQVISWYSPLPTDYWTRPIEPNNREWAAIGGNYPYTGDTSFPESATSSNYYGPFITAPNTPHIVWKRQGALAGIIGGETGNYATLSSPGTPSVIFMGRAYQTVTKVMSILINGTYRQQPTSVAECYDLRTGQIYYDIPVADGGITPTHIAYWKGVDNAVPGAGEAATFGVELHAITGSASNARLYKINPYTGAITVNVSLPNLGSGGIAEVGYFNGYYLSYQNSGTRAAPANSYIINWTEQGSSTNFTSRIVSNVSVSPPPSYRVPPTIAAAQDVLGAYDPESGIGVIQSRFYWAGVYGGNLVGLDFTTGKVLWNITSDPNDPTGTTPFNMATALAENGKYFGYFEQGYWKAYDLRTGQLSWTTHLDDYPWAEFSLYTAAGYNGILYYIGYTGVWALNETNGNILWHYVDPAPPFETPYSSNGTADYSVETIKVIDGKLFVANNEHTPSQPATRGWGLISLNATTGKFLWKIYGTRMSPGAASDGYLTAASSYDGYMYVLGKGKSKTMISAPQTAAAKGQAMVITGSVMDESPAQPDTPAVSDSSMSTWMDYLHMQMPIDGLYRNVTITGVPVTLTAIDANGSVIDLGTVTTNGYYGTFSKTWTAPNEGDYQIIATFAGDNSYGSSSAATDINIGPAPEGKPSIAIPTPADYTMTILGVGIAVIIAVLIATILLYRKE